ncbi:hypothetical protein [Methylococcus sp. EFPC2]|uniref:hypothetical protein n=1 Tax=Methylococcus sp. EFPC2 TaxID=2812648 RepID=UPI001967F7A1|nr:hypothetical protein [Methylococcus sp. EFPC2]QSA98028.1 hypothetical protein JWZ97_04185 [Methylococcus sp. EFPC2]
MVEYEDFYAPDEHWDAGFEAGRSIVLSRLGPYLRVYARPARYVPRFWHRVHELPVYDWTIDPEPLRLGAFCRIGARLQIRFQPTLGYARAHLEALSELDRQIRENHAALLHDLVEQEMRWMETDAGWLESGCAGTERAIEQGVHELLALRSIQSRCRCQIEAQFDTEALADAAATNPWSRHRTVYEALRRRSHAEEAELARERAEQALAEQRAKLKREEELLEIKCHEEAIRRQQLQREIERLRAELEAEETKRNAERASEARQGEEQIRHMAQLRKLEMESDLQDRYRRAAGMDEMEEHLKREIELLAMERQRLMLEDEIREVRLAKARGWVINAEKRFPLGERENDASHVFPPESSED